MRKNRVNVRMLLHIFVLLGLGFCSHGILVHGFRRYVLGPSYDTGSPCCHWLGIIMSMLLVSLVVLVSLLMEKFRRRDSISN